MIKTLQISFQVLIVCSFIICSCSFPNQSYPDARKYLDETLPSIVKHWDPNDLRQYLVGDYKAQYKSLFAQGEKKLGSLKSLGDSSIKDRGIFCYSEYQVHVYDCRTPAKFEKGTATILTSINLYHGTGKIDSLNIEFK